MMRKKKQARPGARQCPACLPACPRADPVNTPATIRGKLRQGVCLFSIARFVVHGFHRKELP
jgi:hypothetical protein